jgi:hypothetical protein
VGSRNIEAQYDSHINEYLIQKPYIHIYIYIYIVYITNGLWRFGLNVDCLFAFGDASNNKFVFVCIWCQRSPKAAAKSSPRGQSGPPVGFKRSIMNPHEGSTKTMGHDYE